MVIIENTTFLVLVFPLFVTAVSFNLFVLTKRSTILIDSSSPIAINTEAKGRIKRDTYSPSAEIEVRNSNVTTTNNSPKSLFRFRNKKSSPTNPNKIKMPI
jgi:hypothetical protein